MKTKLNAFLVILLCFCTGVASAQSNTDSNAQAGIDVSGPPPATDTAQPTQPTKPSINKGSSAGKSSQDQGSMINKIIGAAMIAAGMAQEPPNAALIMMGAFALMQSAQDAKDAGQSGATFDASYSGNPPGGSQNENTSPTGDNNSWATNPPGQQAISELSKAGYTLNKDGSFTGPDGKKITGNDFSSAGAMQSAGFDAKSSADAAAYLAKVNAENAGIDGARISSIGVDGGGGGGGGGSEGSEASFAYKNPWLLSGADKRKMVEGKSVNFAGEPIGVRGDNLFDMVHRAYERKVKTDNFIDSAAAASARLPASAKAK